MNNLIRPTAGPTAGATRSAGAPRLVPIAEPAVGAATWHETHDNELRRLVVGARRPLVLLGRSARSARCAGEDAHRAARSLCDMTGFDVTAVLPTQERLTELLRSRGHDVVDREGAVRRRFLLLDLAGAGIVLCLSTGASTLGDPGHADVLAEYIRHASPRPAGVFARRTDRYSRSSHELARLYAELQHLRRSVGAWAGDGTAGTWRLGDPSTAVMLGMIVDMGAFEQKTIATRRAARLESAARGTAPREAAGR